MQPCEIEAIYFMHDKKKASLTSGKWVKHEEKRKRREVDRSGSDEERRWKFCGKSNRRKVKYWTTFLLKEKVYICSRDKK